MERVIKALWENQDKEYALFQGSLIPNVPSECIIGVRTPILRDLAKKMIKDQCYGEFLRELPHMYFEEDQLHGFIISELKDFQTCIEELEIFLPYMNNWATCDQTSPKIFKKYKHDLLPYIRKWVCSEHTYMVRFAIGMLMKHFLEEDFKYEYIELVADIRSDEYYINMEIAWYMATALAKQWDSVIPYIETHRLDSRVHNKTIQKARESRRITPEQKEYLRRYISGMR